MRQFSAAGLVAALFCIGFLTLLVGCGGGTAAPNPVAVIVLTPTSLSLNEGQVGTLSAQTEDYLGNNVVGDVTFSSSNSNLATVSSGGLVCGGTFDSNSIVCSPNGDGQVTITATSGTASATATVYVHKQVDRVVINSFNDCSSVGQAVNPSGAAYNTSSPGCTNASPCDITSTVGPITYSAANAVVVASAAGINPNFNSTTNSPTYTSGGTITGSQGQTCNLSDFSVGGGTGIDPNFSPSKNSPTYTSGGSVAGTAGQTCTLTNFNGVTAASAIVVLTDTNTIASGARLAVTASGYGGGNTAPTTATLGNGTATCSGTANVITSLLTTTGASPVIGATGTVALTGANTIASGTHLTITNQGYGATAAPTTAILSNGTATCSGTASVVTTLNGATGLSAQSPGTTSLYATVSGVNSVGTPFIVCPVEHIYVHDANGSGTNFLIQAGATQSITADVYDSKGQYIKPNLNWASSQIGVASVGSAGSGNNTATITGVAPGATAITATCSSPNCNVDLSPIYSWNVITTSVGGGSSTTVYAASTQSTTMVPISTSTNTVGTAITLPNVPNSIIAGPLGSQVFLGADSGGVMVYTVASNAVTTLAVSGHVLAVTADGNYLLISDGNNTYFYSPANNTSLVSAAGTSTVGAMTPDSKWSLSLFGQTLLREGISAPPTTTSLSYSPDSIDLLSQGSLAFITSSSSHSIDVRSTCDQSELQTLTANNPTFIKGLPNGTGAVAVDSPSIDVITTPQPSGSCPMVVQNTLNSYDLKAGNFTPQQLFLSFDSSRAWVIGDLSSVITFDLGLLLPTSIPLANSAQALNGGITLDSQQVYVGANDNNVHRIDVPSLTDAQQIAPGLKDANGNVVAPNLVAVLPK